MAESPIMAGVINTALAFSSVCQLGDVGDPGVKRADNV